MNIDNLGLKLNEMPRNVKVNIAVLPLWSIPFNLVNSFASLYMLNQGITASKVGLINSICFILKTLIAIFAGYIINRFGRRTSLAVLDFFGWAVPMLIYSFATEYWQFALAALINCITVISGIASQCFLVEDVEKEKRLYAFNLFFIISSICSLMVPVTGFLIKKVTLVPAMRYLYMIAFIGMSTGSICKFIFLKETSMGREMINKRTPLGNPIKNLLIPMRYVMKNQRLVFLFSMNILINFTVIINNLFYFPYLTISLHFSASLVSLFPFATTIISLFIYFFIIPKIRNMKKCIIISVAMYAAGALALLAAYFTTEKVAYLCVFFWAIGGTLMNPVINTMIANTIKDEMRTEVAGFFNMFSMLCMFPAGYLGGWLYEISPIYPICFIVIVYVGCMIFFALRREAKAGANEVPV